MSFSSSSASFSSTPSRRGHQRQLQPASPQGIPAQLGNAHFLSAFQAPLVSAAAPPSRQREMCAEAARHSVVVGPTEASEGPVVRSAATGLQTAQLAMGATPAAVRLTSFGPPQPQQPLHSQSSSVWSYSYSGTYAEDEDTHDAPSDVTAAATRASTAHPASAAMLAVESRRVTAVATLAEPTPHTLPRPHNTQVGKTTAAVVVAAELSSDPFMQVQQQLHPPRIRANEARALAKAGAASGVPAWWSRESSVLPEDDPSTASTTSRATSAEESDSTGGVAMKRGGAAAAAFAHKTTLPDYAELRERVLQRRRARAPAQEQLSPPSLPPTATTSTTADTSCGCPTSCTCRTDQSSEEAPRHSRRHPAVSPRRKLHHGYVTAASTSSNDSMAGTTPLNTTSSSSSEDGIGAREQSSAGYCGSCYRGKERERGDSPVSSSLCSSCEAAARAHPSLTLCATHQQHASHKHARHTRSYARRDPFADAVLHDTMWAEVPPLLHLSMPVQDSKTRGMERKTDAQVLSERERALQREAYMRHAALLAAGSGAGEKKDGTATAAAAAPLARCTTSVQTDLSGHDVQQSQEQQAAAAAALAEAKALREREARLTDEHLRHLAAAQCAEVALPMLQRELESYETRATSLVQQQLETVMAELRGYQEKTEQLQRQHAQDLLAQRAEVEAQALREAQALERQKAARQSRATLVEEAELEPIPLPLPPPPPPMRSVGTQHTDGTRERLAVVQSEAMKWMLQHLSTAEAEWRARVVADEADARERLLRTVEEPTRRCLLWCQAEVLRWRACCADTCQLTAWKAMLRELELQENLARQELQQEAKEAFSEARRGQQQQLQDTALMSQQQSRHDLQITLDATQQKLDGLEAEHADALEHVRQLRLQLIHALRMPTVTIVERGASSLSAAAVAHPAPGAPLLDSAFAYATATVDGSATAPTQQQPMGADDSSSSAGGPAVWETHATMTSVLRRGGNGAGVEGDLPVHRRFARAHQEALRVTRAQCRSV